MKFAAKCSTEVVSLIFNSDRIIYSEIDEIIINKLKH